MARPALLAAALLLAALPAAAEERPLWELGVGLAGLSLPDYRGAGESQGHLVPYPHIVYHGDFLDIDRDKVRGRLFSSERVDLDISLAGSPPVKSNDNAARRGMPDLDPAVEIGPSLELLLLGQKEHRGLFLKLPLRAVVATDLTQVADAGWTFSPYLEFKDKHFAGNWTFTASAGPIYGSDKYHQYYYDVAPAYATATRPAYSADTGYSGSRATLTLDRRIGDRLWLGGFVRYDDLSGAAFESSPLVEQSSSLMGGVAVTWFFAHASKGVASKE